MAQSENVTEWFLFVDDEHSILNALRRELHAWSVERHVGVETASSALAALELMNASPGKFCVVVSDLRMPVMKGSDFLMQVRERWPDTVTILLSGFSEVEEVMKAVKAGIFSYLLKPWDQEYLASELDKALALYRLKQENEKRRVQIDEELKWAGEMQRTLLKPNPINTEGVEFRSSWKPVPGLYCGGDYYDVIGLGGGRYLILVGDVAGHGIRGALVTAMLKAVIYPEYVRSVAGKRFSPGAFLSWLNDRVNFELRKASDLLVAFFAAVLDRNELSLTYANAGLPHPLIIRAGSAYELPVAAAALGFSSSVMYTENAVRLIQGDIVFAFSDGLSELMMPDKTVRNVAVKDVALSIPYGPDYHKRVFDAVLEKGGAPAFTDDVTLVTATVV